LDQRRPDVNAPVARLFTARKAQLRPISRDWPPPVPSPSGKVLTLPRPYRGWRPGSTAEPTGGRLPPSESREPEATFGPLRPSVYCRRIGRVPPQYPLRIPYAACWFTVHLAVAYVQCRDGGSAL